MRPPFSIQPGFARTSQEGESGTRHSRGQDRIRTSYPLGQSQVREKPKAPSETGAVGQSGGLVAVPTALACRQADC